MRRIVVSVSMFALVVGLFALSQHPDVGAWKGTSEAGEHPLVGSWMVVLTVEGQGPIEITNLITFAADGTVLAASGGQLPGLPAVFGSGLVLTEGHGAWAVASERSAEATFRFLTLDQTGGIASTNTSRMAVEADAGGNSLTGAFTLDLVSPSGNSMGAGRGTLRAERIAVEPMAVEASPIAASPTA